MNGLIFAGCSITWGQGLYFYSDLPRLVQCSDPAYWDINWVTQAQLDYKNANRYSRLVANHFETFDIVNPTNGGSNDESMKFISSVLNNSRYIDKDLSYIVLQLTHVTRDDHSLMSFSELQKEYPDMELTVDNALIKVALEKVEVLLRTCEDRGIKALLYTWPSNFVEYIQENDWLNRRFITLSTNQKEFNSLEDLLASDKKYTISTDTENLDRFYSDDHPSKSCHKVIANSIIKKIENENI